MCFCCWRQNFIVNCVRDAFEKPKMHGIQSFKRIFRWLMKWIEMKVEFQNVVFSKTNANTRIRCQSIKFSAWWYVRLFVKLPELSMVRILCDVFSFVSPFIVVVVSIFIPSSWKHQLNSLTLKYCFTCGAWWRQSIVQNANEPFSLLHFTCKINWNKMRFHHHRNDLFIIIFSHIVVKPIIPNNNN